MRKPTECGDAFLLKDFEGKNVIPGAAIPAIVNSYGDYVNSEDKYKDPPPTPASVPPVGR